MGSDRVRIRERIGASSEVRFALLFGSRAGSIPVRTDSDWDLAVYLDDALDARERARVRDRIIAALEPEYPVDVVILNDAPPLLAHRALGGETLLTRDRTAYVRFFVRTLAAAFDEAYWSELHARKRSVRLEEGRFGRP